MLPEKSYVICTTPRSGSSLLCNLLTGTNLAGRPAEYLFHKDYPLYFRNFNVSDFQEYIPILLERTSTDNGVFGVKAMSVHFFNFTEQLRTLSLYKEKNLSTPALMSEVFPDLHYIWLTRRDRVRQAVSQLKAMQTGVWHSHNAKPENWEDKLAYSFKDITNNIRRFSLQDATWQNYFDEVGVSPLTIVYEDFVLDREGILRRIFDYVGIETPPDWKLDEVKTVQKLADETSELWVKWYLEERRVAPDAVMSGNRQTSENKPKEPVKQSVEGPHPTHTLTSEDIAKYIPLRKIIEAVGFKLMNKPGFGWLRKFSRPRDSKALVSNRATK